MRLACVVLSAVTLFAGLSPALAAKSSKTAPSQAAAMAEKFLAAMGGREVWARATYVHSKAVNHHPQARLPYIQEYWTGFEKPRTLNRLTNFDMNRLRGFNVDHGWGVKEGETYKYDAERVKREQEDWQRSIYAKLIAIARRDKDVKLNMQGKRLTFRRDSTDLGWIELNADGSPKSHAGTAEGAPVTFGPLIAFGDLNWPRDGREENGWNFEMLSIELGAGPLPVSFEMPDDLSDLDP